MLHSSMPLIALVFAAAIGLALGTLGGGGSVLTVPVLVYVLAYDPKVAVPTSLCVVGAASLMGAVGHWRARRVDARIAVSFGLVTMTAAFVGARLALRLPAGVQLALLAVVTVVAAALMLRPRRDLRPAVDAVPRVPSAAIAYDPALLSQVARLTPVGLVVGLLTGIIGVGGGFLIVPALVLWGGIAMPTAVGTSLVVIALNCGTSLLSYLGRIAIPWSGTLLFTAVAVTGAAIGTSVVGGVPPHRLRQIFGVFLLFVGGFVLFRSRSTFHIHPAGPASTVGVTASPVASDPPARVSPPALPLAPASSTGPASRP